MNINLLPSKFIKNRATDVIVLVTVFTTISIAIILGLMFLYYFMQAGKYQQVVEQAEIDRVRMTKKVAELKAQQSQDIQLFLTELKSKQVVMAPIMEAFSEKAAASNLFITSYEVQLQQENSGDQGMNYGLNREELLPSVTIKLQGSSLTDSAKFKAEMEAYEWVYDCLPVVVDHSNGPYEIEYVVRLIADKVKENAHE